MNRWLFSSSDGLRVTGPPGTRSSDGVPVWWIAVMGMETSASSSVESPVESWMPKIFAWACVRTETMALQPIAVRRQINGALRQAPRPAPETVRRGFIAAVCHFGVLREATVAAQAGGEPRAPDQLGRAVSQWSEAVFGGDVRLLEMTEDGLRPPAGTESTRPRKGLASRAATA